LRASPEQPIALLSSGVCLGAYIPAVQLWYALGNQGQRAYLDVLEQHFSVSDQQRILGTRDRYQQSFRLALAGRRLHGVIQSSVEVTDDERLFALWRERKVGRFVVLQGQWMAVLSRFLGATAPDCSVEVLHLDVRDAPSWRAAREGAWPRSQEQRWLSEDGELNFWIGDDRRSPVPFAERRRALVVHGGGWALGDFVEQSGRLSEHFEVELLAGSRETLPIASRNVRVHTIPPSWAPWNAPHGRPYPPLIQDGHGGDTNRFHELSRRAVALVSKPGGSTLLESIASATPIVFLRPCGEHEEANARAWVRNGFGLTMGDWERSGFALEPLERQHHALLEARGRTPNYCDRWSSV
jgi:hypothetical protein